MSHSSDIGLAAAACLRFLALSPDFVGVLLGEDKVCLVWFVILDFKGFLYVFVICAVIYALSCICFIRWLVAGHVSLPSFPSITNLWNMRPAPTLPVLLHAGSDITEQLVQLLHNSPDICRAYVGGILWELSATPATAAQLLEYGAVAALLSVMRATASAGLTKGDCRMLWSAVTTQQALRLVNLGCQAMFEANGTICSVVMHSS